MSARVGGKPILAHRCHGDSEGRRYFFVRHPLAQHIQSFPEIHVCSSLDKVYAVSYTIRGR